MLRNITLSVIAVCAAIAPAWAGEGDAQRGAAYAVAMCSTCHAATADEAASPNPAAKPFRSMKLANLPGEGTEAEKLTGWFNTTHPNTTRVLKDAQGDDIAALIAGLSKQ